MTYHGAGSCKSTGDLVSGVECDPSKLAGAPGKYIRYGGLPRGEDQKEYDLGRFSVATVDFPTSLFNQVVGELWVSYTVMVRRPRLAVSRGLTITQDLHAGMSLNADPIPGCTCAFELSQVDTNYVCWPPSTLNTFNASGNSMNCLVELCPTKTLPVDWGGPATIPGPPVTDPKFMPNIFTCYSWFSGNGPFGPGNPGPPPSNTCTLQPLQITFPAAYSGDIEVKYSITVPAKSTGPNTLAQVYMSFCGVHARGNITGIQDFTTGLTCGDSVIPQTLTAMSYTLDENRQSSSGTCSAMILAHDDTGVITTGQMNYTFNLTVHVQVDQSTGGTENQLFIGTTAVCANNVAALSLNASQYYLSIAEYNSGFTKKNSSLIDWVSTQSQEPILLPNPRGCNDVPG